MTTSRYSSSSQAESNSEAVTDLTLTLFRLHGVLMQWGDRLVKPLGLTSARWQMLGAIAIAGKALTAPQIAAVMGVTRQGAQKQLNLLLELDCVVSTTNPAHRRSPLYKLTPSGLQLYQKADELWRGKTHELSAQLKPLQLKTTTTTLLEMLNHFSPPSSTEDFSS